MRRCGYTHSRAATPSTRGEQACFGTLLTFPNPCGQVSLTMMVAACCTCQMPSPHGTYRVKVTAVCPKTIAQLAENSMQTASSWQPHLCRCASDSDFNLTDTPLGHLNTCLILLYKWIIITSMLQVGPKYWFLSWNTCFWFGGKSCACCVGLKSLVELVPAESTVIQEVCFKLRSGILTDSFKRIGTHTGVCCTRRHNHMGAWLLIVYWIEPSCCA